MQKHQKKLLRLLKVATKERTHRTGRATEKRFLDAMNASESKVLMPGWIKGVKLTKPWSLEDRNKIDAVITTDVGKLYLQIKSSDKGAVTHFKKFTENDARKKFIGVIVIRNNDSVDRIRAMARSILEDLCNKLPPGARAPIGD